MNKETPITKYLAALERRQARMGNVFGTPSPTGAGSFPFGQYGVTSSRSPETVNIRQRLRFEDETFMQPDLNESLLHLSPPTTSTSQAQLLQDKNVNKPFLGTGSTFGRSVSGSSVALEKSSKPEDLEDDGLLPRTVKRKRYSFEKQDWDGDMAKKISNGELEKLLRLTQADLVETRATVSKLQHQKTELTKMHGEKNIQIDRSNEEMKIKCRNAIEKMEEMERKQAKIIKSAEEWRDKYFKELESKSEKISSLESKNASLEAENMELKLKMDEGILNQSDSINKASADLEESERGAEKWVIDCQILQDQLSLRETQLQKYQQELKDAQEIVFKYKESERKLTDKEGETNTENLDEKVKQFENLYVKQQNENRRLKTLLDKQAEELHYFRGTMKREMLLEEKITTLENELLTVRNLLSTKAVVEAERDSLNERLCEWTNIASKIHGNLTNPQNFHDFIRQTQNSLIEIKHENADFKCRVDDNSNTISELQTKIKTAHSKEQNLRAEVDRVTSEYKQISRRFILITKDRDSLKALKESYEQEFEGVISAALRDRTLQLEELVTDYEKIINGEGGVKKSCTECEKRISLISELKSELEKVRREKFSSESTADVSMASDGNTTGFKIVTFGLNPSALSLEERIRELNAENEKLRDKIKQYDDQSMLAPSESSALTSQNKDLEQKLKTLERKHEILTEAYNYETQQLQTALTKLFGFHVTLIREPQPQLRLQSIYFQNPGDMFIFQEAENADMMLLETPILDHFREDIDRFLLREGSIPAFLAAATIGLGQGNVDLSQAPSSQPSESGGDTFSVNNPGEVQVEVDNEDSVSEEEEDVEEEEEEQEPEEDEEEHGNSEDEEDYESENSSENEQEGQRRPPPGRNTRPDDDDDDVVMIDSD